MDYKQRWVITQKNKQKWLKICPTLNDLSGIYILTREENLVDYAYIGQAQHILTRLAEHLTGYLWIDCSLKKHGLYTEENKTGWNVDFINYPENELNIREQQYIAEYIMLGYQVRNKTTGSQDTNKKQLDVDRSVNGYRKGVKFGYNKAIKEVKEYFDKYLGFYVDGKCNKIKLKKFQEFKELIGGTDESEND